MADTHNTICDKVEKCNHNSTQQQTTSSHAICPLDPGIKYIIRNISDNNRHCLSYIFKLIF